MYNKYIHTFICDIEDIPDKVVYGYINSNIVLGVHLFNERIIENFIYNKKSIFNRLRLYDHMGKIKIMVPKIGNTLIYNGYVPLYYHSKGITKEMKSMCMICKRYIDFLRFKCNLHETNCKFTFID